MSFRIVATLGPKDAGDIQKALKGIDENDTKTVAYLGVIIGMADGVSYRSNKFNPEKPAIALTGVFEATPYDTMQETVQGSSLFLSGAVQDMLVKAAVGDAKPPTEKPLKLGQKIDVPLLAQLKIIVEVGVKRNDGEGQGYTFVINHAGEAQRVDVLERLRAEVGKEGNERMKALAAGRPVAALAAPEKAGKGAGASKKASGKK